MVYLEAGNPKQERERPPPLRYYYLLWETSNIRRLSYKIRKLLQNNWKIWFAHADQKQEPRTKNQNKNKSTVFYFN